MASLERRKQTYRVVFMYAGKKWGYSLDTGNKQTAEALRGGVEKTLMLIQQGLLTIPADADVVEFIRSGGKITAKPSAPVTESTFSDLRLAYLAAKANGSIELNTLETIKLHLRHMEKTLGDKFSIKRLTANDLQRHIDRRCKQTYRGKPIGSLTVRKEITALKAMWNWGVAFGWLTGTFPGKGLTYPKTEEKTPFMTLEEIEKKVSSGDRTPSEIASLLESLYLQRTEIDELLVHVKAHAAYPWIYPLICTAAHTGMRRSELLRVEVDDVDFANGVIIIREKKRSKGKRTTRHVSMSPLLKSELQNWISAHPGGRYLFCQTGVVDRSRKRSSTTGHQSGANRASTTKGRQASIRNRADSGIVPVTKDEAHDHFKRTLKGSRWQMVRGFHVLRHSFISCLAAAGVDQRIIDEFVGHCTEEQRRRYRHLIPEVKRQAIITAFG